MSKDGSKERQSMSDDPNRVVVLTTPLTEAQGAMIVAALEAQGVQTQMTGGLPFYEGPVQVLVRYGDLEQAQSVLQAIEKESGSG